MVVDSSGNIKQIAGSTIEVLHPVDLELQNDNSIKIDALPYQIPNREEKIYKSLVMGVRDYVNKNHFPGVLLGLSGGIDSALTLAIAVDALGPERVSAIFMPSRFTSDVSRDEATLIAKQLGVNLQTISIEEPYESFLKILASAFANTKPDTTEENIQARCRAIILMALSNKTGRLVLTTGNRSEMAVGYTTLYGDMAGGFGVLKDVPKTVVYELAKYRNKISPVIPARTITRAPTAELRADQKDEDSLPPYPILDKILELYLNQELSIPEIVAQGYDEATVNKIVKMIIRNEYKRRQAPIGTRINYKSFGKDRRYPVTSGFKG